MKIKTKDFKEALDIVKPGLASKELISQTTSFVFAEDSVVTYNDEICIVAPLANMGFTGAIKSEELYNFLGKVKVEEINLDITETAIEMKAGRATVGFALATEITLPLDELVVREDWEKLPKKFNKACKFAVQATSDDSSNPKINCVFFDSKKGHIAATDNYRLVRFDLRRKIPFKTTLIPASAIKEVIKLKPVMASQGNGWIHFKNEDEVIISCRVYNETFVDINSVIDADREDGLLFTFPEQTVEVLDRAIVFSSANAKVNNIESVELTFKGKFLKIESKTDNAWFKESIPVKGYKGDEFNFKITPYLLKDILADAGACMIYQYLLKFESEDWLYLTSIQLTTD